MEMGKGAFPFEIKLYQNKIPQVIVNEAVNAENKLLPSLAALMQKFPVVFLELKTPGVLLSDTKVFFKKLETPEKLIVIAESPAQVEADIWPVAVLPTLQSALLRLSHKSGIEKAVSQIANIPQMQSSVFKYLELLNNEKLQFQNITKALDQDVQLSSQILTSINSFEQFVSNPFQNLSRAIQFVGVEGIRHILIEKAFVILSKVFTNQKDKLCHLRRCQVLSGMLGSILDSNNPHLYWRMRSAALMHDIGSLLMAFYNRTEYDRCFNVAKAKKLTMVKVEDLLFGYNHQEAGILMAKILHLPQYLLPSISCHHKSKIDKTDVMLLGTIIANGYINSESERIGFTNYDDCLVWLEEAKAAAEQEKLDKELAKRLSRVPADDVEARKRVEEEFYKQFEEVEKEEQIEGFKDHSKPNNFDVIRIETLFKEKLALVLKDGYESPLV